LISRITTLPADPRTHPEHSKPSLHFNFGGSDNLTSSQKVAGLYDILLDALCCVIVSDGKASHDKKATILGILIKVNSPHSAQDVNSSIESFIKQVKERGFSPILNAVLEETRKFRNRGKQKILLKAFALVAKSDGSVDEAERKVIARFKAVLQESPPEN